MTFSFYFGTRSHCVTLAGPELTLKTRLGLNLQRSTCAYCLSGEIKGLFLHYTCSTLLSLFILISKMLFIYVCVPSRRGAMCGGQRMMYGHSHRRLKLRLAGLAVNAFAYEPSGQLFYLTLG